jgi:hypothetical protein
MFDKTTAIKVGAAAATLAGIALLTPLLWALVSAGVATIIIAIIGVVLVGLIQSISFLGQKWENKLLAMRKAEARENPIEQHQNSARRMASQIEAYKKATTVIDAQIQGMKDMVKSQRKKDPNYDFERTERGIEKMQLAYQKRLVTIDNGEKKLAEFRLEIEREIFEWDMAKAARSTSGMLSPQDEANIMAEILDNEASRSVRESFNMACAELDMEVRTLNDTAQLQYDGGLTLDLSAIQIPVREKVIN